jgi:osmotically-inducible protein OsmY
MVKTCAVAVVLATALAMAQSSAPSQNTGTAPQSDASQATASAQNTAPAMQNGAPQTVAATPDTRAPQTSADPADQALARQVLAQFAHRAEFQNVTVSVADGVVTLEGSVPTKVERRQAKALARGVGGVKKVQEHLSLTGAGVSGPGTAASTTTTAQNNAGSISGNEKAEAGTVQGTSAMSQTPSTSAAPSLNPGTQPARTQASNGGGITGAAVNTPPSSTVGAGTSASAPPPRMPIARTTNSQSQPQQAAFGLTNVDTASLASRINTALKNDPTLANNNVMVNVGDQGVEVTGTVDTGKEKLTAMRIAQSYAGNFKVVDRITLAGHAPAPNGQQQASQQQASQPPRTTRNSPPANVPGNQVLPTSTANQARDPKNAGDKSASPR